MRTGQQIDRITAKVKRSHVFEWDQDICFKEKKNWKPDTNNKNIQPGYKNEILHGKICYADNENWEKRNNGRRRTTQSGKH